MTWTTPATADGPSIVSFSETDLGSSDKTLDLAALGFARSLRMLELTSVRIEFSASSEAGTRTLQLQVQNGSGDVIWAMYLDGFDIEADGVQSVNLSPGVVQLTGAEGRASLPLLMMRPGWRFKVWDSAAVDVGGDDLVAHVVARAVWG